MLAQTLECGRCGLRGPRWAEIYDWLDADPSDLDVYDAMVDELGARSVPDIGCGTGCFACLLARRGVALTGVDPAEASLAVALRKPQCRGCAVGSRRRDSAGDAAGRPGDLAEFYRALVDSEITYDDGEWVTLRDGGTVVLSFQLAPDYQPPVWPSAEHGQQFHIDVTVDDIDRAEAEVLALGATNHHVQPPEDEDWRVYVGLRPDTLP